MPLTRFHSYHGENIILSDESMVAYRKGSFAHAITFSEKPLLPNEIFLLEIERNERGWSGHIRLGLTLSDPTTQFPLPKCTQPEALGNSWIFSVPNNIDLERSQNSDPLTRFNSHSVIHHPANQTVRRQSKDFNANNRTHHQVNGSCPSSRVNRNRPLTQLNDNQSQHLTKKTDNNHIVNGKGSGESSFNQKGAKVIKRSSLCSSAKNKMMLPTDVGSQIGIMYVINGQSDCAELHFVLNGEDQGVFGYGIPYKRGPLYAVADIYGTTKQVRIVQLYGVASLKNGCREAILSSLSSIELIPRLPLPLKLQDYLLYCH